MRSPLPPSIARSMRSRVSEPTWLRLRRRPLRSSVFAPRPVVARVSKVVQSRRPGSSVIRLSPGLTSSTSGRASATVSEYRSIAPPLAIAAGLPGIPGMAQDFRCSGETSRDSCAASRSARSRRARVPVRPNHSRSPSFTAARASSQELTTAERRIGPKQDLNVSDWHITKDIPSRENFTYQCDAAPTGVISPVQSFRPFAFRTVSRYS